MKFGFKRNHRLIAIGDGIVQDAVAFVASVLFRGVDWIFSPLTCLLSKIVSIPCGLHLTDDVVE